MLRDDLMLLEQRRLIALETGSPWVARLHEPLGERAGFRVMNHAEMSHAIIRLMASAFSHTQRDPRSTEYRDGARALLTARLGGTTLQNPYKAATAQADAWWAGVEEGKAIYQFHLAQGVPA